MLNVVARCCTKGMENKILEDLKGAIVDQSSLLKQGVNMYMKLYINNCMA
jgi:hypothetical protein